MCIPAECKKPADAAIKACIKEDRAGRGWWQPPQYESHRVVRLERCYNQIDGDGWMVVVESTKRI